MSEDKGRCPGNGRACKEMGTERTKMRPYMKELERLIGYTPFKSRFNKTGFGHMDEKTYEDEEETEVVFNTFYKNPIIERDEKISSLQQESSVLKMEIPMLKENLLKTTLNWMQWKSLIVKRLTDISRLLLSQGRRWQRQ